MKPKISQQIFENTQTLNLIKIRPEGSELLCAGQTDWRVRHDDANSRFSQSREQA